MIASFFLSPKENYEDMTPAEDDAYSEELTDRRLKDHNDLHVLDFGKFVFFCSFLLSFFIPTFIHVLIFNL